MAGWRHRREGPLPGWCDTIPGSRSSDVPRGSRSSRVWPSTCAATRWTTSTMAPYALFGVVAMGALSQIPGSPAQRARTLLAVLPVGWVLVTLGTLLSVSTATAVAGMFVLGFAVAYAGIGGPRLVGLATGTQLLYILPCFPPFDPGSLGFRLAGLTLGVLLLAAAEVTLWPDPTPTPYTTKLADAVAALARCLDAVADMWSGRPEGQRAVRGRAARGDRRGRGSAALAAAPGSAARLRGTPRPRARVRRGLRPAPPRPHGRPFARRRPLRRHAPGGRRPPAPDGLVRRRGGGLAARRRREQHRGGARYRPDRGRARRVPRRPRRHFARRPAARAAAAGLARAEPRRVDEVDGRRHPGGGGRADPARPDAAVGPARPALVRLPQHPGGCGGTGCASTSRRARSTSRARCGWRWRSRWPGCWPGCSTSRTGSGCCSPCSRSCAPRPPTPARPLRPALVGTTAGALVAAALLVVGVPAHGVRGRAARRDAGRLRRGPAARPRLGAGPVHAGHRLRLRAGLPGGLAAGGGACRRRRDRRGDRRADRAPRVAARRLGRAAPRHRHVPRGRGAGRAGDGGVLAADAAPGERAPPRPRGAACSPTPPTRSTRPSGTRPRAVDWQATLVAGHHAVRGAEALLRGCPTGLPAAVPRAAYDGRRGRRPPLRAGRGRLLLGPRRPGDGPAAGPPEPRLADRPRHATSTRSPTCASGSTACATTSAASRAAPTDEADLRTRVAHLADGAAG